MWVNCAKKEALGGSQGLEMVYKLIFSFNWQAS
ncbi:hypothetical protein STSP2_03462 [Anaerohalosphaera lusitana]|uniref:Uncharacterized protein n=1 Tax=Anaerohalosphaera lusitana TaxID=1936003 RepID=A0A1U9NRV8_9BACT|nr:hypothetical protein STSP2_03462 [Anaerohalosphaera lusitana]